MEVRNSTLAKALLCIPLLAAAPCMTIAIQPAAQQKRQPDAGQQTTPRTPASRRIRRRSR